MTKALLSLTLLCGVCVAFTAFVLRYELAAPGISSVFSLADGTPNTPLFYDVMHIHRLLSLLAVMLLGTTLAAVARGTGAVGALALTGFGAVLSGALFVLIVLSALSFSQPQDVGVGAGVGWTLYPDLNPAPNLLEKLAKSFAFDPLIFVAITPFIMLAALFMLMAGAFMALARIPTLQWVGLFGMLCTLAALASALPARPYGAELDPRSALQAMFAVFIVAAALAVWKTRAAWATVLLFGAVLSLAVYSVILSQPNIDAYQGTMLSIALNYIFPFGLVWFALPAAILMSGKRPPRVGLLWATLIAIPFLLSPWLSAMLLVGRQGQPHGYIDYPDAFAPANLTISYAVLTFVVLYCSLLWRLRTKTH